MGGLQQSQMARSKRVNGHGEIVFPQGVGGKKAREFSSFLRGEGLQSHRELQVELLLKFGETSQFILARGIDPREFSPTPRGSFSPGFEVIPSFDLSYQMGLDLGAQVQLISPSHTDLFLEEIPRSLTLFISDFVGTKVPEVDAFHVWVGLRSLFNLVGEEKINRIVLDSPFVPEKLTQALQKKFPHPFFLETWEEKNGPLVFALKLEAMVMLFLFVMMSLLVSMCVISGLLIFFRKIRKDLASFWILGSSKKSLDRASWVLVNFLSLGASGSGILAGVVFLVLFKFLEGISCLIFLWKGRFLFK